MTGRAVTRPPPPNDRVGRAVTKTNVFYDGTVHVNRAMCSTCIFRPGNLMHLEPGRVEGMVAHCYEYDGVIPCHQGLNGKVQAVCRGQFDRHPPSILQIADRLNLVTFVPVVGKANRE